MEMFSVVWKFSLEILWKYSEKNFPYCGRGSVFPVLWTHECQFLKERFSLPVLQAKESVAYLDELELEVLGHLVILTHAENVSDDVFRRISHEPKM